MANRVYKRRWAVVCTDTITSRQVAYTHAGRIVFFETEEAAEQMLEAALKEWIHRFSGGTIMEESQLTQDILQHGSIYAKQG